ncbi:hypothetical protein EW145_g5415 [Phellinidium pouzarii]|uniref:Uncharacterized protein n=1 Tax=Phellinidium pouzarii TaxID=167371 RepID=A0A4S4L035_9AGAM|nr:hypothetical protein EW145_g5415 [Phellinidium pouzarii]
MTQTQTQSAGLYPLDAAVASEWSLSTNATEPNLPGPGRTLGLAYDYFGAILERLVNRPKARTTTFSTGLHTSARASSESIDTNATAPNLPGP